jgi:hypothetical protein
MDIRQMKFNLQILTKKKHFEFGYLILTCLHDIEYSYRFIKYEK